MSDINDYRCENVIECSIPTSEEFEQVAKVLCEKALSDAKSQLHPLLQNTELDRLDRRPEFLRTFKRALEQQTAQRLATWYPSILTIFSFEVTLMKNLEDWDGSIHLLSKVPHLLKDLKSMERQLDTGLVNCLKQWKWQRFQERKSILEAQQVTLDELRRGMGYGAMFYPVYSLPVKVWPSDSRTAESSNADVNRGHIN